MPLWYEPVHVYALAETQVVTIGKAPPFLYSPLHRSGLDAYNELHCTLHIDSAHCNILQYTVSR